MITIFKDRVADGIFRNAIASIQLGVEDYMLAVENRPSDNKRLISATRNLFSGVLLLFKSLLAEESAESNYSLLKAKLVPSKDGDKITWLGAGKKTVEYEKIKENLRSIDARVDFDSLSRLHGYRNDIEHYYDANNHQFAAVESFLADAFEVVSGFFVQQLGFPRSEMEELITPDIFKVLVDSAAVINNAKKRQDAGFSIMIWHEGSREALAEACCPKCGTSVLLPEEAKKGKDADESQFKCRGCGEVFFYEEIISAYADKRNEDETNVPPGDIIPPSIFFTCDNCRENTFSFPDKRCINCGHTDDLRCKFCDNDISEWEYDFYLENKYHCPHCAHMLDNND